MLANFQEYFPDHVAPTTNSVFPTTLTQAPISSGNTGYLNEFYDDELWWAIAWIEVYDATKEEKYLDMAAQIFEDPKSVWGQATCGGLWLVFQINFLATHLADSKKVGQVTYSEWRCRKRTLPNCSR
jgi:hypothetical protein